MSMLGRHRKRDWSTPRLCVKPRQNVRAEATTPSAKSALEAASASCSLMGLRGPFFNQGGGGRGVFARKKNLVSGGGASDVSESPRGLVCSAIELGLTTEPQLTIRQPVAFSFDHAALGLCSSSAILFRIEAPADWQQRGPSCAENYFAKELPLPEIWVLLLVRAEPEPEAPEQAFAPGKRADFVQIHRDDVVDAVQKLFLPRCHCLPLSLPKPVEMRVNSRREIASKESRRAEVGVLSVSHNPCVASASFSFSVAAGNRALPQERWRRQPAQETGNPIQGAYNG
jgi:hypothetical protein